MPGASTSLRVRVGQFKDACHMPVTSRPMPKDKSEKKERKKKDGHESVETKIAETVEDVEMEDVNTVKVCLNPSQKTLVSPGYSFLQKTKKPKEEEITINVEDLSPIARPLAQRKLVKKLHKTIKKGTTVSLSPNYYNLDSPQLPRYDR